MNVYYTPNFVGEVRNLQKKSLYASLMSDVCNFLGDKNIQELHIIRPLKIVPDIYSLNKYRIANETMNSGKRSSYRCVSACMPKNDSIYLDTIYSKTGSDGVDDLDDKQYKEISNRLKDCIARNDLYQYNSTNGTFVKVKPPAKSPVAK